MTAATAAPPALRDLITDALELGRLFLIEAWSCADCAASPKGLCCPDHEGDLARAELFDGLRRRVQAADPVIFEGLLTAALRGTEAAA